MVTLRQRIRKDKIYCQPWKYFKEEIKQFPISSKCLFANSGVPWDVLEPELKSEGWLFSDENLMNVLSCEDNLKRQHMSEMGNFDNDISFGLIPGDWTEEDYEYYEKHQ